MRKALYPVWAVRLFEGSGDDGEKCWKKPCCVNTRGSAGMEGFLESSDEKTNMSPNTNMSSPFPPSLSFFQSYWVPPRGSTSTTKTQMGKCSVQFCVCVSPGD